jgi:hypothetical protein
MSDSPAEKQVVALIPGLVPDVTPPDGHDRPDALRAAFKTKGLSDADYDALLQQASKELFFSNKDYRNAVVHSEVRTILMRWAAIVGLVSLGAIAGLLLKVYSEVEGMVKDAVTHHIEKNNDLVKPVIASLASTAAGQIVDVQGEVKQSKATLEGAIRQSDALRKQIEDTKTTLDSTNKTLDLLRANEVWLGDTKNADRVVTFIKQISSEKGATGVSALLMRLDKLEARVISVESTPEFKVAKLHQEQIEGLARAQQDNNNANDALSEALHALSLKKDRDGKDQSAPGPNRVEKRTKRPDEVPTQVNEKKPASSDPQTGAPPTTK